MLSMVIGVAVYAFAFAFCIFCYRRLSSRRNGSGFTEKPSTEQPPKATKTDRNSPMDNNRPSGAYPGQAFIGRC